MIGIKMGNNSSLLKALVALCICAVAMRFGEFAISRIPPLKEGECANLQVGILPMKLQVIENHLIEGTSSLEVQGLFGNHKERATFAELRALRLEKVSCDE